MLKENSVLRADARVALQGKWPMAAVAALIYSVVAGGLSGIPFIGWLCVFFIGLPIGYGFAIVMLGVFRGKDVDFGVLFEGFQDYGRIFVTKLLQMVYTFLWSLLLVIPGIIKGYSYAMTDFILKEDPEMKNNAAIEKSMAMMEGNKMKLFLLDLSFIGWAILSIITFGIGFFFLQPYIVVARAAFYEDLKAQGAKVESAQVL